MLKTILFFTTIIIFSITSNAQITILENSKDKFVIQWNIEKIDTALVKNSKSWNTLASFKGQNVVLGKFKEPAIPGYSFFIGVPSNGEIKLSVQPQKIANESFRYPLQNQIDSSKQVSMVYDGNDWVSRPVYSHLSSLRVAHLFVRPIVYDSRTNNYKVMLSGTITIEFPPSVQSNETNTGSFFSQMKSNLLLNYSIAKGWTSVKKLAKKYTESYPFQNNQKMAYFKIGDGHSGLNECTTNENGIVKIQGSKIISIFGSVPMSKIALYASCKGPMDEKPPIAGKIPDGIEEIPLLKVDRNNNGLIDTNDYVLAYVSAASDWVYHKKFEFVLNHYDDYRTYWLTVKSQDGLSMKKFSQPTGYGDTVQYFDNYIFYKQSISRPTDIEGGNEWVWKKLTSSNNIFNYSFNLPLIDTSFPGTMKLSIIENSSAQKITFGDSTVDSYYAEVPVIKWGSQNLRIDFNGYKNDAYAEFKDVTFKYKSKISLKKTSQLRIFSSGDSGIVHYKLTDLKNEKTYIFRIDSSDSKISLLDTFTRVQNVPYIWTDSVTGGQQYFVCTESQFTNAPELLSPVNTQGDEYLLHDLRNTKNKADYIIITHPDFLSEASSFAAHKKSVGFNSPRVIDINEIYRSFSGGNKDPTAIRNFLTYVKRNWVNGDELYYVVLFGNGTFDPKNLAYNATDYIPIYQDDILLYEDYYSYTEPDSMVVDVDTNGIADTSYLSVPQLIIGRFPCTSKADAAALINKTKEIETIGSADFGPWRNRALLVADDDMQADETGPIPDPVMNQNPHYRASDMVETIMNSKRPSMDVRKAYLFEYEWNALREKPQAKAAIINEINNGVAYVNYFGHGADVLWADEHVLSVSDIPSLYNTKQYPLVSSFSCSVGKFDNPEELCLSSALVNKPSIGASATISSTRVAFASVNEILASAFYNALFDTTKTNSIGMAFYIAKILSGNNSQRTYALFGDPSLCFVRPERNIDFQIEDDSTHLKIDSTMMALEKIKIKGSIKKLTDNSIDTQFGNGTSTAYVKVGIFNPSDSTSRKDGGTTDYRYPMPGAPVFLGKTAVHNGTFEQTVLLSKNLTFDKKGAKITVYAWRDDDSINGIGARTGMLFHGTSPYASLNDSTGPQITIRPYSSDSAKVSFNDKITTSSPVKFFIDIYDESGIDVSGTGPDEGLTLEIPGMLSKCIMNSKFQFKEGNCRLGYAPVSLDQKNIKPGSYDAIITARDLLGNLSKKTVQINVVADEELTLDHVFNFPNPFKMGQSTRIYFSYSLSSSFTNNETFTIKIYSLSGRILRVFPYANNGILWDGRDQMGNILSPNIYLYQVTAYNSSKQKTVKSKIKKIVIQPPK